MMDNNRDHLYISALLSLLKPLAKKAGVSDFTETHAGKLLSSDDNLTPFFEQGYALAKSAHAISLTVETGGRLVSIFDTILDIKGAKEPEHEPHAFPLLPLTAIGDICFPYPVDYYAKDDIHQEYAVLWRDLDDELSRLSPINSNKHKALLSITKKYTWCVPSDMSAATATSLFDMAKSVSALAICLHDFCTQTGTDIAAIHDNVIEPFLLVGCDVSGIQNFIYNIASRKAAVSLKGRSFYVQLLIDSIIQRISIDQAIKAFPSQVVYSSGGKCYMVLPNTEGVKNALREIRAEVEHELFGQHYGQLSLNIESVPFGFCKEGAGAAMHYAGITGDIGGLWNVLAQRLTDSKYRRFRSVLDISMFAPHKVSPDVKVCAVTGIESADCVPIDPSVKEKDRAYVLPIVKEEADLGRKLKDAKYILSWTGDGGTEPDATIFGVHYELLTDASLNKHSVLGDNATITVLNHTDWPTRMPDGTDYDFKFYGGNRQALDGTHNKTFEQLADNQYLGVLRMDVDNLGAIFVKGLPETAKNFAAYSTLSFLLDYFFSGYLNSIRADIDFKDDVNILYSGGDDVFAIGRWDKLLKFAQRIRIDFGRFVGRNDISISGGVVFVGETFPIAKAAYLAGEAEDKAKKFDGGKKNAICMFDAPVSWAKEFDYVDQTRREFVDLICHHQMPRGILHRLMLLCDKMRDGDVSYLWHTAYYLKRFSEGKPHEVVDFCRYLQCALCDKRKYELTAIAARWAEYQIRFNNQQ